MRRREAKEGGVWDVKRLEMRRQKNIEDQAHQTVQKCDLGKYEGRETSKFQNVIG